MKVDVKKLYFIAIFFLLLLSFNVGISHIIYLNSVLLFGSLAVSCIILFILSLRKKINRWKMLPIIFISALVLLIIMFRNVDISNGLYTKAIYYAVIIIAFCLLVPSDEWFKYFKLLMLVFILEHLFCTWFFAFFKDFYFNNVLPIFRSNFTKDLISQFRHGYVTGLTTHYSHNGMYLSLAVLFFFSSIIKKKNWLNISMFILSMGGLLLTGKRGHFIFVILTLLFIEFIINRDNLFRLIKKVLPALIVSVAIFALAVKYIPALNNTFMRLSWLSNTEDVTNGRSELYKPMYELWKNNPVLGAGWGSAKYTRPDLLVNGHNVYLQILAECGIIGEILFLFCIFRIFKVSIKTLKKVDDKNLRFYIIFALSLHTFFVLYCVTGNPLYDIQILYPLLISIASVYAIKYKIDKQYEEESI